MGRIQQIQSFSTFDGPGTRCVVFLQGCPVACSFCHNPDSWEMNKGEDITVDELMRRIERYRPFMDEPGLTLSGGEPMVQPEFTFELIKKAKAEGWHVALDTSGWGIDKYSDWSILPDLLIFSVKHAICPEKLSNINLPQMNAILDRIKTLPVPVRLRYVLIHGKTDSAEDINGLKYIIHSLPNLEKIEILPYNSMAENKWNKLQWNNPLFSDDLSVNEKQIKAAEALLGINHDLHN